MPPRLIEDEYGGIVQLALDTRRKHAHDDPRRHHADHGVIARKRRLDHICKTRKIYDVMRCGNAAAQTLGQVDRTAALHRLRETADKLCAALRQGKERCSHDFAFRNMCENPAS